MIPHACMLVALFTLFVVRLTLASLLVPMWQHPDEPQHLEHVATLATQGVFTPIRGGDPTISAAIVQSMAEHRWWAYYSRKTPSPLPSTVEGVGLASTTGMPRLYYVAAAAGIRLYGARDVETQYWLLRVTSAVLGVITAAFIWLGTRAAFSTSVAHGTLALLVLQPQFTLGATAVNPDAVVNLCGALLWWQAGRVAVPGRTCDSATPLAFLAAIVGALAKRAGLPLLAMATLVGVVAFSNEVRVRSHRARFARGRGWAVPAAAALAAGLLFLMEWRRIMSYAAQLFEGPGLLSIATTDSVLVYARSLVESAWLNGGWLTLPAPQAWYTVALAMTLLTAPAVLLLLKPWAGGPGRRPVLLAIAFCAIQIGAVLATYYRAGYCAQGRYFFPAIGPFLALVWLGAVGWLPRRWAPVGAGLLLAAAVWLDVTAWTGVLIPGFAR